MGERVAGGWLADRVSGGVTGRLADLPRVVPEEFFTSLSEGYGPDRPSE